MYIYIYIYTCIYIDMSYAVLLVYARRPHTSGFCRRLPLYIGAPEFSMFMFHLNGKSPHRSLKQTGIADTPSCY